MGGKKPLRRPLWPPTRATASNYYPLGLDGAGGAAKPLLRAPKKPAPLHGRLPAFSGAVDAFERARKCFLEWRYFFSIILSEFLKNRVALQLPIHFYPFSSRAAYKKTIFLKKAKNGAPVIPVLHFLIGFRFFRTPYGLSRCRHRWRPGSGPPERLRNTPTCPEDRTSRQCPSCQRCGPRGQPPEQCPSS